MEKCAIENFKKKLQSEKMSRRFKLLTKKN